jgi:hypothetical protein
VICKEGKGNNPIIPPIGHHSRSRPGQPSNLPPTPSTIARIRELTGIENSFFPPSRMIQVDRSPIALDVDASGSVKIYQASSPRSASLDEFVRRFMHIIRPCGFTGRS